MDDIKLKILSHDVNNKLAIIGFCANILIKSTEKSSSLHKYSKRIMEQVNKSSNMLNGVMNDSSKLYNICDLVNKSYLYFIRDYKIKIKLIFKSDLYVKVSEIKFQSFLENIVKNSKESGSTALYIIVTKTHIHFVDNGSGFSKPVLKSLNSDRKYFISTKNKGHGIGTQSLISLCKVNKWNISFSNRKKGNGALISVKII